MNIERCESFCVIQAHSCTNWASSQMGHLQSKLGDWCVIRNIAGHDQSSAKQIIKLTHLKKIALLAEWAQ